MITHLLDFPAVQPARQWQGMKQRATQFGDYKNYPGKDSGRGVTERSSDYFKRGNNTVSVDEPATTPTEPGKGDLESNDTPTA